MISIKKCITRFLLVTTCLIPLVASPARASTDLLEIGAAGLVNFSIPRYSYNSIGVTGTGGGTAFGGGVFASLPILPAFRIESGVFYVPEILSNISTVTMFNELQVPLILRFTLLPFLSVGAGGYAGFAIGNVSTTVGTAASTSTTYAQQFLTQFDWGLVASAQLDLPINSDWSFMVDARYLFGLQDMNSTTTTNYFTGGVMILAGFKYSL